MPDFVIEGNPGNVRSKALTMEQKGQLFYDTGDALAKIDVSEDKPVLKEEPPDY